MANRDKPVGFTLIELLIVVAIIAILAAIAVPNFMEPQTRAKITRSKSDLRTIGQALDTYAADNNRFPMCSDSNGGIVTVNSTLAKPLKYRMTHVALTETQRAGMITTPVAYMSALPHDTNVKAARNSNYGYYCSRKAYFIWGFGPNRWQADNGSFQYSSGGMTPFIKTIVDKGEHGDSIRAASAGVSDSNGEPRALTYDSTNGTISFGEIWRMSGGVVP